MTDVYGRDFALIYNQLWGQFSAKVWPVLHQLVRQHAPRAASWLDVCCGTGHLLGRVAAAGFRAWGLDFSRHQLKYARLNAPAARLLQADMCSFRLGRTVDIATCLYDSINYLTRRRDALRAFRCVRRHLSPDGLYIFDVNTAAGHARNWHGTAVQRAPDIDLIMESSCDEARRRARVLLTGYIREGRRYRRCREEHIQRSYDFDELHELLTEAGLSCRAYSGFGLKRRNPTAARLVFVCRRS
jgi:SAM-dependent methyltransferase